MTTRRDFLKTLGGVTLLTVVPRKVLGHGMLAPSDELTKGIIGVGGMGRGHIPYDNTRVVAMCDVDKDIFCEKPMTRTIGEGKRVREAIAQHGNIFRLNTWFRFRSNFYGLGTPVKPLKKLVDSGMLGWPLKVTISKHTGFDWKFYWVGKNQIGRAHV